MPLFYRQKVKQHVPSTKYTRGSPILNSLVHTFALNTDTHTFTRSQCSMKDSWPALDALLSLLRDQSPEVRLLAASCITHLAAACPKNTAFAAAAGASSVSASSLGDHMHTTWSHTRTFLQGHALPYTYTNTCICHTRAHTCKYMRTQYVCTYKHANTCRHTCTQVFTHANVYTHSYSGGPKDKGWGVGADGRSSCSGSGLWAANAGLGTSRGQQQGEQHQVRACCGSCVVSCMYGMYVWLCGKVCVDVLTCSCHVRICI